MEKYAIIEIENSVVVGVVNTFDNLSDARKEFVNEYVNFDYDDETLIDEDEFRYDLNSFADEKIDVVNFPFVDKYGINRCYSLIRVK